MTGTTGPGSGADGSRTSTVPENPAETFASVKTLPERGIAWQPGQKVRPIPATRMARSRSVDSGIGPRVPIQPMTIVLNEPRPAPTRPAWPRRGLPV